MGETTNFSVFLQRPKCHLWLIFTLISDLSYKKIVFGSIIPFFPTGAIEKIYRFTKKEFVVIIRIFVFTKKDGRKIQSDGYCEKQWPKATGVLDFFGNKRMDVQDGIRSLQIFTLNTEVALKNLVYSRSGDPTSSLNTLSSRAATD